MPALLSENITRRRLPTFSASACVLSSCAWPSDIANSPSNAMTFGDSIGAPTMSQNAALPAAVAMPMPDGPPLTSLVTSMRLDVAGQRADAAALGLREQRMIGEPLILQQRLQRAGAAAEAQRVDRQHRDRRLDVVAAVAGRLVLPAPAPRP